MEKSKGNEIKSIHDKVTKSKREKGRKSKVTGEILEESMSLEPSAMGDFMVAQSPWSKLSIHV